MSFPINEGLWDNIHAKRERIKRGSGERMRKPGSEGAPTEKALKQSQTEDNLFDFVYDFLISENLTAKEALDIMARVPIEEILEVIELDEDEAWRKRNFRSIPDDSVENVAKAVKKIKSDIVTQRKRPLSRFRPRIRREIDKGQSKLSSIKHALIMKKADLDARAKEFDVNTKANTIKRFQREEFILEYLLDYGYADTYENAIEIYESMSDDWMIQILSEEF